MNKHLEVDILGGGGPKAAIFEVDKTVADRNRASKLFAQVQHAEDATRLVACWNACEGMTTENIEALPAPVSFFLARLSDRTNERDELLAALEEFHRLIDEIASSGDVGNWLDEACQFAETAIAKAKADAQ